MIDGEMDLFMNQCIDKIIYTEGVVKYDCHLFTEIDKVLINL